MRINPQSLALEEETNEERLERENRTGESGTGLNVSCHPVLEDPTIVERKSRVSCMARPYAACGTCQHSSFVLLFNAKPTRYEKVACPRWASVEARLAGDSPESYVMMEEGSCSEKPFEFCPSCPSRKQVSELLADKGKEGWFGRWQRLKGVEFDVDPR